MQRLYLKYCRSICKSIAVVFLWGMLVTSAPILGSDYSSFTKWLETPSDGIKNQLEDGKYNQTNLPLLLNYFPPGYFEEFNFNDVEIFVQKELNYQPHEVYGGY